jgi:hypothetical protein
MIGVGRSKIPKKHMMSYVNAPLLKLSVNREYLLNTCHDDMNYFKYFKVEHTGIPDS